MTTAIDINKNEYEMAPIKDIETGGDSNDIEIIKESNGLNGSPVHAKLGAGFKDSPFSSSKSPQDIKWKDINFTVKGKTILKDCWGEVPAGKTMAIMGASGAGKSSLLNVLAGRSAPSKANGIEITGRVNVQGKDINPVQFRKNIAYVMQEDAIQATSTPREALEFSAKLRLPDSTSDEVIKNLVDHLLEDLGLTVCADVLVGGALIKGISGGQRKRTSVGIELITNPSLLFLDEPTTGLDSYTAYNCVSLLKSVAGYNTAVLCTIHQPSSEVFFLFDLVIFMNSGRILYQGPVNKIVSHFTKYGYECPANYNPSDYIMLINQTETPQALEDSGVFMALPPDSLFPDSTKITKAATTIGSEKDLGVKASLLKQFYLLTEREVIATYRDTNALATRFGTTIFLNILYGCIFLGVGGKDNGVSNNFNAHFGGLTMSTIGALFGASQATMLMFPFERPMFLREYSTGTYTATAYFVSKILIELPLVFVQTVLQFIFVYFMMDLQGNFILLVLASWGLAVAACSIAVILGCAIADVKDVTEFAPLLFVPQLLFAGFFIRLSQVPVYLRWSQYLCSLKYAMNLLIAIEFDPSSKSCKHSSDAEHNCRNLLSNNNIQLDYLWLYAFLLFVLFAGFRLIGASILVEKAKRFY
eukprot:gene17689-23279_t